MAVMRRVLATAALSAACALLGVACGGTTGREGLPIPGEDGGEGGTAADATVPAADASLESGAFDVDILYVDRILPDSQVLDGGSDSAFDGPTGLSPCTSADAGLSDCVSCQAWDSGICTPTEAQFVALDISRGLVTAPGPDTIVSPDAGPDAHAGSPPPQTCYECLFTNGCIDSPDFSGNECEPVVGMNFIIYADGGGVFSGATGNGMFTTPAQCEAVIHCILGSGVGTAQCASKNYSDCYCGSGVANAICSGGSISAPLTCDPTKGPIEGVCAAQMAIGLGFPCGDGADIASNTTTVDLATGQADQIFTCANSNNCPQCL
jgi:hypothetical protein